MPLSDLLIPEFDREMHKTRATLERVPEDKLDFKPHDKSMSIAKLAGHTAQLPQLLSLILTTPNVDLANSTLKPIVMSTREELLGAFDAGAATARAELSETADRALHENWKLSAGPKVLFEGSRYHAARSFFFNHIVHHRAQLGVYLRLNDVPVPSIYGPSADESI